MIELDFGPGLLPAGGSRDLGSEDQRELFTSYFSTEVLFTVNGKVVCSGKETLLEFLDVLVRSCGAVDRGEELSVPSVSYREFWSVVPDGERVRIDFRRYLPHEKRHVPGSVSAGRAELLSAWPAFVLRALDCAESEDPALGHNPWTRTAREQMTEMAARWLDRSIIAMAVEGGHAPAAGGRLACRVWSYGGLPDAVPGPVRVEAVAAAGSGHKEVTGAEMAGAPIVEAIVPPEVVRDADALVDAVWPGFAELLEIFGGTDNPLYRAALRR